MASNFINEYTLLLIKQYFSKPKARAEIELYAENFEIPYKLMRDFPDALDVDLAIGDALDKVGKIVGVPRNVPLVIGKIAFGFADNPTKARGFFDKFVAAISAPFFDRFSPAYTDQQLDDYTYRQVIKAKIAVNNTSAFMVSDERISVQDVIQLAFNGRAYVVDKKSMSLWLYITPEVELDQLRLIVVLNLLPKPQAVRYDLIVQAIPGGTFGFADNEYALSFGDRFGSSDGYFANKVII